MNLKKRIKKNDVFKEILDIRDSYKCKSCSIFFKKNDNNSYNFGISVSKKIGNAVIRNYIKRRIRACLKDIDDGEFENYYDFIIIAKPSILNMTFKEIYNEINGALSSQFIGEAKQNEKN